MFSGIIAGEFIVFSFSKELGRENIRMIFYLDTPVEPEYDRGKRDGV